MPSVPLTVQDYRIVSSMGWMMRRVQKIVFFHELVWHVRGSVAWHSDSGRLPEAFSSLWSVWMELIGRSGRKLIHGWTFKNSQRTAASQQAWSMPEKSGAKNEGCILDSNVHLKFVWGLSIGFDVINGVQTDAL